MPTPAVPRETLRGEDLLRWQSPCVYVWRRRERYLYVGCSKRGLRRLLDRHHGALTHAGGILPTDTIEVWEAPDGDIYALETKLIQQLRPSLNGPAKSELRRREFRLAVAKQPQMSRDELYRKDVDGIPFAISPCVPSCNGHVPERISTGRAVREFRRREGIRTGDLSAALNLLVSDITDFESGRRAWPWSKVRLFENAIKNLVKLHSGVRAERAAEESSL